MELALLKITSRLSSLYYEDNMSWFLSFTPYSKMDGYFRCSGPRAISILLGRLPLSWHPMTPGSDESAAFIGSDLDHRLNSVVSASIHKVGNHSCLFSHSSTIKHHGDTPDASILYMYTFQNGRVHETSSGYNRKKKRFKCSRNFHWIRSNH